MRTIQQYKQDVEAAERAAKEEQAWYRWISANRAVVPCEANRQAAIAYLNGEEMTLEALTDSFQSPDFRARLALQTTGEEREKLLTEYTALLTGSPEAVRSAIEAAKYLDNEQIRVKTEEIQSRKAMQLKPVPELRQIVANARPAPEQAELPANMTREYLLSLSKPGEFRRIVERYGSREVTKRLNQR